jgi:hypothetical protein
VANKQKHKYWADRDANEFDQVSGHGAPLASSCYHAQHTYDTVLTGARIVSLPFPLSSLPQFSPLAVATHPSQSSFTSPQRGLHLESL